MSKIPKIKKQEVWNYYIGEEIGKIKCLCCSINFITQLDFHLAHIVAKSNGGDLSLDNLRPICAKCNQSMGNENMILFMKRLKYDTSRIEKKDNNLDINTNKHVWSEKDEFQVYLCYRFPEVFNLEYISNKLCIKKNSVKIVEGYVQKIKYN